VKSLKPSLYDFERSFCDAPAPALDLIASRIAWTSDDAFAEVEDGASWPPEKYLFQDSSTLAEFCLHYWYI